MWKTVLSALILSTAFEASLQIESHPGTWQADFRFWTSILTLTSLLVIFTVQYYEHWRSRQPNGVVLFYWVFFIVVYAVKLRSLVAQEAFHDRLPYFIAFNISLGLALVEFILEY